MSSPHTEPKYGALLAPEFQPPPRFELREKLGAGAMGVVYRALDRESGAEVALKTLLDRDAYLLYRFKEEFRQMSELDHPNLVRVDQLFEDGEHWFFTMELVEGTDLLSWVRDEKRAGASAADTDSPTGALTDVPSRSARPLENEARLREAFAQLATGLEALHASGKIHCDVKPANVRVRPDGRVVLLDFGLVIDSTALVGSVQCHGTVPYMAPEQAAEGTLTAAADWYSFGAVLFEALTGRYPFEGPALKVMVDKQSQQAPRASSLARGVPPDLDKLTASLLHFDPAVRPTAETVRAVLGRSRPHAGAALPSSRVTSMMFVGRSAELRALHEALARVHASGEAEAVVVLGESGVGKSELVRHFCEQACAANPETVALSGRCYEREFVPFRGFDGVIDALSRQLARMKDVAAGVLLPRDAGLLARVFPVLRRVRAMGEVPEPKNVAQMQPMELRTRVFAALRELLARFASSRPVVIVIDDLQWASKDTATLLQQVFCPPETPSVLLLATARTGPGAPYAPLPCRSRELLLGPLDLADSQLLAGRLLGDVNHGNVAELALIAREAHGHPLFIQELSRHYATGQQGPEAPRLDDALRARVGQLAPEAQRLLELVCIAGSPLHIRTAANATELTPAEAARWSAMLRAGHLLRCASANDTDSVEPYHDRVREAVSSRLSVEDRRALHARLATTFESEQLTDPLVLVQHLEAAGLVDRAAEQAEHAARRASESLAVEQALSLYRRALALRGGNERASPALRLAFAWALVNAGRPREASEAFLLAAHGADRAVQLELRGRAAVQALLSGAFQQGEKLFLSVLLESGVRVPQSPLGAVTSLLWHRLLLWLLGYRSRRRDTSEIPAREILLLDLYTSSSLALGLTNSMLGAVLHSRALVASVRVGESRRLARSLIGESCWRAIEGNHRHAERLYRAGTALLKREDPDHDAWSVTGAGYLAYAHGRFVDAIAFLNDGSEVMFLLPDPYLQVRSARVMLLFALARTGDFRVYRRRFETFLQSARQRGDAHDEGVLVRSCHLVWLIEDAVATARTEVGRYHWREVDAVNHLQTWYEHRALIECDLYEGRTDEIESRAAALKGLARSLLQRAQVVRIELHWVRARLALALADAQIDREAALRRARACARAIERERIEYARAWSELVRAALAVQQGATPAAVEHLRRASVHAGTCHMNPIVAVARWREGELLGGLQGERLRVEAEASLRAMGVKRPDRWVALSAPGFRLADSPREQPART